jgi:hypothetical protein
MTRKATGEQKTYRNEGASQLLIEGQEINPGDEFKASLDPLFETQMLGGGHLVILADQSKAADEAQAAAENEQPAEGVRHGRKR